jgi:hypothetical protein
VRRVLFDLNYTVVEQLEALDDELFVLCATRTLQRRLQLPALRRSSTAGACLFCRAC